MTLSQAMNLARAWRPSRGCTRSTSRWFASCATLLVSTLLVSTLLVFSTLLVCSGVLSAQSPRDTATDQAAVAVEERARDINRVLHLTGGGSLRGRARWVDDHWEIRRDGEWTALAAQAVERAVDERGLLVEAKSMERELAREDWPRRVAYAEWLWRAGLLDESFGELERVLATNPDQSDALKLLRAPPSPISVPGESSNAEEAVRSAALAPTSLGEIAIARFAERTDGEELKLALRGALDSHSPKLRVFATRALRRMHPGGQVREMLARAVLDGSECVRREASFALRDVRDESVIVPVLRTLSSSSAAVRANAADALGEMGYPAAVLPLVARLASLSAPQSAGGFRAPSSHIFIGRQSTYVQDYDVEVAQFASVADPQINVLTEGSVLDVRVIGAFQVSSANESRRIRSSLSKLTGADPGQSNRAWLDWWEQNKSRYERKQGEEGVTATSR